MNQEYELIEHSEINGFRVFLVDMLYRTPHNHKDIELCLLLRGEVDITRSNGTFHIPQDSFYLMNSFEPHELKTKDPALILALQISPDFFAPYYPQAASLSFGDMPVPKTLNSRTEALFDKCIRLASAYLRGEPLFELRCASLINDIFLDILEIFPWENISSREQELFTARQKKVRYLTNAVDARSSEKLLLSDLAEEMEVSVYYLSHFFKQCFGVPFQEYLSKVRCEKARQLLLLTDQSLLDISIAAGFSDPKYFNRSFKNQYGMSPKEYRSNFENAPLQKQQQSMLTTQEFLSKEASLVQLERYLHHE